MILQLIRPLLPPIVSFVILLTLVVLGANTIQEGEESRWIPVVLAAISTVGFCLTLSKILVLNRWFNFSFDETPYGKRVKKMFPVMAYYICMEILPREHQEALYQLLFRRWSREVYSGESDVVSTSLEDHLSSLKSNAKSVPIFNRAIYWMFGLLRVDVTEFQTLSHTQARDVWNYFVVKHNQNLPFYILARANDIDGELMNEVLHS